MNFLGMLKIEFMKVKRGRIVPLIFIAPLLVVVSGVANLSQYFTLAYTNAWAAMFMQSALVYAYYLLPFSMIVVCVMIAGTVATSALGVMETLPVPTISRAFSLFLFLLIAMLVFVLVLTIAVTQFGKKEMR